MRLTVGEKKILRSAEGGGGWRETTRKSELRKYMDAASHTLKKDARLNIRISSHDLNVLRKKASDEGLPYQTYVSSILHKFVSGRLAA